MEFSVPLDVPFSLEFTLESGQVFRWEKRGEWWYGIVAGSALKMKQEGDVLRCSSSSEAVDGEFVSDYFRLDDDLNHVLARISRDRTLARAVQKYYGLRLVRQDVWECLASFVLATNANIPRIKKMVSAISERYGRPFDFDGDTYRAFPDAEALARASVADLQTCGLGYRSPFLKKVSESVAGGKVDFTALPTLDYVEARKLLLTELLGEKVLLGVGPKVADCVLLYSCGKDEAFPIDVWIARALANSYPRLLDQRIRARLSRDGKLNLSLKEYDSISRSARKHFGAYAGYAQQYLYMAAREVA